MALTQIRLKWVTTAAILVLAASGIAAASTPTYTNGEVVSVNTQQRLLVVRAADGAQQTLELEDNVAGLADLRPGDRVILTLRGEAGRPRVQAFTKSTKADARTSAQPEPAVTATDRGDLQLRAADNYSRRVADLAAEASRVDGIWSGFRTSCNVNLSDRAYEGSREWLSLWDSVQVDLSSGHCRELFNQIVGRGQSVNAAMSAAETEARRSLEPGAIREIQRQYSLEWSGWGRTPPKRVEQ